ncbi:enoyl-CoA hydratase/isomerase family protein [Nitratireductor sp. CH_MIT9313-5]|uniref:enoyl-CoA hydratase/isomerase family protein n=1 Tax=Nitratireductor sp. CH_MIT9313-5 TaxID=3107764 RepID=UPI003009FC29
MIGYSAANGVATLTLSRPPVNAIDAAFVAAFREALDRAEAEAVTVLVIRSDQKCFCAGADLAQIARYFDAPDGVEAMRAYVKSLHAIFDRLEAFPAITLAAIDGPALGGGLEMALACDLRLATTRARLGLPEARVGMIPGAGGTQRLTRICGPGVSARIILGCEIVDGAEAARLGIVQWSCAPEALDGEIATITGRIAGLSRQALLLSKDCIAAYSDPTRDGFARELDAPGILIPTEEARSRVRGFFQRKAG